MTILLRPIMTEKSMKLAGSGEYTFEVVKGVNKEQIKKTVEDKFKVDVLEVKIIFKKGEKKVNKSRLGYARGYYQKGMVKKAIVKVQKGQVIPIFEVPKEEAVVTTAEGEPIVVKEKKDILRRTKVKVERVNTGVVPTTQRKVITGK